MKKDVRNIMLLYGFIVVLWTIYRMYFHFTELQDELFAKPLVWLIPTIFLIIRSRKSFGSYGISFQNFGRNVLFGFIAGFALTISKVILFVQHPQMASCMQTQFLPSLLLSFLTATSEEIVFRGYLFTVMQRFVKQEYVTVLLNSLLFVAIHIPILLLVYGYKGLDMVVYLSAVFLASLVYSFVYLKRKSVVAPIVTHLMWNLVDDLIRC